MLISSTSPHGITRRSLCASISLKAELRLSKAMQCSGIRRRMLLLLGNGRRDIRKRDVNRPSDRIDVVVVAENVRTDLILLVLNILGNGSNGRFNQSMSLVNVLDVAIVLLRFFVKVSPPLVRRSRRFFSRTRAGIRFFLSGE